MKSMAQRYVELMQRREALTTKIRLTRKTHSRKRKRLQLEIDYTDTVLTEMYQHMKTESLRKGGGSRR